MEESEFWNIIETSKAASDGSFDGRVESLGSKLSSCSPEQILAFQHKFDELQDRAYAWDLWGAAYLIGGGCSDDSFMDFRSWLISNGRQAYEQALQDPDSLAEIELGADGEEDAFFEEFAYVAGRVYEAKVGKALDYPRAAGPEEPSGETWEEEDLERRFPRLAAKYAED